MIDEATNNLHGNVEILVITNQGDLPDSAPSDRIIEKSVIGAYFDAVKAKYNMVNPRDIKDYAQDMFHQI